MYNEFDPYDTVSFEKKQVPVSLDNVIDEPFKTDVNGIEADAYYSTGIDSFPIFDINNKEDFLKNYSADARYQVEVPNDSKIREFMDNTPSTTEFYLRYKDENGTQLKKVR